MQHRCAFVASLLSFSANLAFSAKTGIITIEGQEGRPVDKPSRTEEGGTQYGRKRDKDNSTESIRFKKRYLPLKAVEGKELSQMYYARKGKNFSLPKPHYAV